MKKISTKDAYNLGLLYIYEYSNKSNLMGKVNDLYNYSKLLDLNIINKETSFIIDTNIKPIYFTSKNVDGEIYYIINPNIDIKKVETEYMKVLPQDILIASRMPQVLLPLGIIEKNGILNTKDNYFKEQYKILKKEKRKGR